MTALRFEDVVPEAALFLALVRGRLARPEAVGLAESARVAAARDLPRAAVSAAVGSRVAALGAPSAVLDNAARLGSPGTVVVVAGQQPVLFGGPHLVVSKALAAVSVARRLEAAGVPAVPLFWVAAEDHDHAEVDHVEVSRAEGGFERLSVVLPNDRRMLAHVELPAAEALRRLDAVLPQGSGRDLALAAVRPEPGDTVSTAFTRIVLRLFGRHGLVPVEPETLRRFATDLVWTDVTRRGALAGAVAAAEDAFALAGFPKPLGLRPREPLFFVTDRAGRRHRPVGLPEPGDVAGLAAWRKRLDEKPAGFSWNVAGRVLAQNLCLPVAAQICGPSEFCYCAAIAAAHPVLGVPAPALLPRPGVTFVSEGWAPAGADGGLQERSLSVLPFLARHGEGMLDRVLEAVGRDGAEHEVLDLGGG